MFLHSLRPPPDEAPKEAGRPPGTYPKNRWLPRNNRTRPSDEPANPVPWNNDPHQKIKTDTASHCVKKYKTVLSSYGLSFRFLSALTHRATCRRPLRGWHQMFYFLYLPKDSWQLPVYPPKRVPSGPPIRPYYSQKSIKPLCSFLPPKSSLPIAGRRHIKRTL